ncbi:hypothetical protein FE782_28645 [Paenibacillus antri]|uniref:AAA+ ATPase domain-containing protein n=1 Tax=Paenibacillus antri TaxID=2582848 RepID=A0A5R9G5P9_9BACL|nr:AAA family ATPase [Paenibacillus antri]TLS48828.1 hypothetical protein FE782_28645 [Paenibacillus antri]
MLQVALFRPHQRQRQAWIDRLRASGYACRFVNDLNRITFELDIVVIDSAVGKWNDYVQLVRDKGVPVVLLVASGAQWEEDKLAALGVVGTVTEDEETDQLFARFFAPNKLEDEELPVSFPQWGKGLVMSTEEVIVSQKLDHADVDEQVGVSTETQIETRGPHNATTFVPLSQRKATRQKAEGSLEQTVQDRPDRHVETPSRMENAEPIGWVEEGEEPEQQQAVTPESSSALPRISRDLPSVVAVFAAKGGVGKTTLLIHLASLLANVGCRVCILDLDLMNGTVASTLQLQPHKTIVDLVRRIDDPKASRACLQQTKMGFSIVAAPSQPGTFKMQREQLLAILRFLKEETDIVLIDTPVHFDALTKLALEQAELQLLMTTDEPASMQSIVRMKPLLSSLLPAPDMYTVWSRFTEILPKEQWRQEIPWPVILELPEDPTISRAVRSGQFIASSPCSPYRLRVKELVDRWMGVEPEHPGKKRNLLARFLSNRT